MRKILFLICFLGMSCASWAQSESVWTNLSTLQPGQRIQVVEMNSKKHSGAFVSFSDAAITYEDNAGGQTIPRQNVRKVQIRGNRHRLRNAVIGGVVGAGVGAGIGAAADNPCSGPNCIVSISKGEVAAVGATAGFGIGFVVGVLLPSHHHTVYNVNSR
jgi:hypothetical protein